MISPTTHATYYIVVSHDVTLFIFCGDKPLVKEKKIKCCMLLCYELLMHMHRTIDGTITRRKSKANLFFRDVVIFSATIIRLSPRSKPWKLRSMSHGCCNQRILFGRFTFIHVTLDAKPFRHNCGVFFVELLFLKYYKFLVHERPKTQTLKRKGGNSIGKLQDVHKPAS
jgi:hypothetical protein